MKEPTRPGIYKDKTGHCYRIVTKSKLEMRRIKRSTDIVHLYHNGEKLKITRETLETEWYPRWQIHSCTAIGDLEDSYITGQMEPNE